MNLSNTTANASTQLAVATAAFHNQNQTINNVLINSLPNLANSNRLASASTHMHNNSVNSNQQFISQQFHPTAFSLNGNGSSSLDCLKNTVNSADLTLQSQQQTSATAMTAAAAAAAMQQQFSAGLTGIPAFHQLTNSFPRNFLLTNNYS